MTIRLASSVADPNHFDTGTDPDPRCDKNSLRIRIQEKRIKHQEKLKNVIEKTLISHVLSVFHLTITIILLIF